jgi:hypothetical protein
VLRRHLAGGAEQGGVDRVVIGRQEEHASHRVRGARVKDDTASIRSPENMGGIGGRIGRVSRP